MISYPISPHPKHWPFQRLAESCRGCRGGWPFRCLVALGVFVLVFLAGEPILQLADLKLSKYSFAEVCDAAHQSLAARIPRIVHQTWKTADVPEKWQSYISDCKRLNPNYTFRFWTDKDILDFLLEEYAWFVPTYEKYPYRISRPDAARYFILRHYGGIYMDIDTKCLRPFDEVINSYEAPGSVDVLLVATHPAGMTNSLMMAKPQHPFFRLLTNSLPAANRYRLTPHWTIMKTAGPLLVHVAYERFPCKRGIQLLPVAEGHRIVGHEQASTWHNWDGVLMNVVDRFSTPLIVFGVAMLCAAAVGCCCWIKSFKTSNNDSLKGSVLML